MSPRSMWPGYTVTNLRIMALPLAANCSCPLQSGTGGCGARDKQAVCERRASMQLHVRLGATGDQAGDGLDQHFCGPVQCELVHLVQGFGDFVQQRLPYVSARLVDEGKVRFAVPSELVGEACGELEPVGAAADHHDAMSGLCHGPIGRARRMPRLMVRMPPTLLRRHRPQATLPLRRLWERWLAWRGGVPLRRCFRARAPRPCRRRCGRTRRRW